MIPSQDIYQPEFVKAVFDRCSDKYIAFSYFCSFGFTERWRRQCVELLSLGMNAREGLDLMSGTGEVWAHLFSKSSMIDRVIAVDISSGMHRRALERIQHMPTFNIDFIEDDVLASKLPDASADFIISTFGLKTFNRKQQRQLAELTARVLRPGGRFAYIEASDPRGWVLRPLYMFHLSVILPMIERVFLRGAQDFAMIGKYASAFSDASAFADDLRCEGMDVTFRRHFFGCATSVSGQRPND